MTLVFIPCANCVSLCLPILLRTYKVYLKIKSGPRYIDPWVPDIGYGPRVNDPDARVCHLSAFASLFSKHVINVM